MNIKSWSNLIYKYYFERELGDRVILHISMQDLIDFAKDFDVEIANGRGATSFDDTFIRNDFVRKFWYTTDGNKDLKDLQKKINHIANLAINEEDYVVLLSIVALLIMPICENDELELHGRDYYGHLYKFLISNGFVKGKQEDTDKWSRSFLGTIHLDKIWLCIDNWAKDNNLNYKSNLVISDNGATQYALSLMKESLLSPSKIQRFGILFDKAGLVPRANIDDTRLLSAFSNYYAQIGIPLSKYKTLTGTDNKEYLSSVLHSEYQRWDGTTKIKERDRKTGRTRIESGNTCYPLLLSMGYDVLTDEMNFALHLYCSDIEDIEDLNFKTESTNTPLPPVYIKNDGYASRPFPIKDDEISSIFKNREGTYGIYEVNERTMKGRFVVTDYYLLKQYKNKYISTNEFVKGEFYFAVIRNEALDKFQSWILSNNAKLISNNILGGFYSAFRIQHAIEESEQGNSLRFKKEIKCRSVNNLEIKSEADSEVVLLSKLLPAQFEITGIDISQDKIYAVSVNTLHRNSSELAYDHEKNLWVLKVFTNLFQLGKDFQLYCNESPIPYGKTYRFSDFILPNTFKELSLDKLGMMSEEKFSVGLQLPNNIINNNLINWAFLSLQMKQAPAKAISPTKYQERDFLLYAITSASYETDKWIITTEWLKSIRDRLMQDVDDGESAPKSDKYALQNALADYFRMGYINYAYTERGLRLVANRPTLVLLTPDFEKIVSPGLNGKKMYSFKCTDNQFKCLLTGGRTIALIREIEKQQKALGLSVEFVESTDILMPQTVYIYAQSRNSFKQLAERCNLLYQDNLYSNALIEALPSVDDYKEMQKVNGYEQDLFLVKHFRSIDYKKMSDLYPDRVAKGRCLTNAEIDKEEYDKNNDVVVFFPGTRDETCVLIDNGRMIEIDKYWGHFIGMRLQNAQVLQYDEDKELIILPQQIRLPLLYARALTLITGKTPSATFGSRAYNVVGQNPLIKACKPETILRKLGQK